MQTYELDFTNKKDQRFLLMVWNKVLLFQIHYHKKLYFTG